MPYSVFLSHSMTPADAPLVNSLASLLAAQGINCYVAERDGQFGRPLAQKIEQAIRHCDCLVALLTKGGSQSAYVNQEIGAAVGLGRHIIPIVEKGVELVGFKQGVEWIEFDRQKPSACLVRVVPHMVGLAAAKDKSTFIVVLILAGLGLWALSS